jgi:L-seryl-tRNA(Ser) seleniumtransferase
MKVGKEEMIGLLAAVKWYVNLDHERLMRTYEDQVQYVIDAFSGITHTSARRRFPSEAGQPMPRAEIIFDEQNLGLKRDEILTKLRDGEPSIALAGAGTNGVFVNPQTLEPGQEKIIVNRIREIILDESVGQ